MLLYHRVLSGEKHGQILIQAVVEELVVRIIVPIVDLGASPRFTGRERLFIAIDMPSFLPLVLKGHDQAETLLNERGRQLDAVLTAEHATEVVQCLHSAIEERTAALTIADALVNRVVGSLLWECRSNQETEHELRESIARVHGLLTEKWLHFRVRGYRAEGFIRVAHHEERDEL